MARSIALAAHQPVRSIGGGADLIGKTVEFFRVITAAGRVGASYRDNVAPRAEDLRRAGLEGFEVLTSKRRAV